MTTTRFMVQWKHCKGGTAHGLFPAEDEAEERGRLLPDLRQLLLPVGEEEQEPARGDPRSPLEAQEGRGDARGMRDTPQGGDPPEGEGTEEGARRGDRGRGAADELRMLPDGEDGGPSRGTGQDWLVLRRREEAPEREGG